MFWLFIGARLSAALTSQSFGVNNLILPDEVESVLKNVTAKRILRARL